VDSGNWGTGNEASTITNSTDSGPNETSTNDSSTISNDSSSTDRGSNSTDSSSYRGGLISNMVDLLGNTDGDLLNSVDWGVDRGDNSLGGVGLVGGVVHVGSLNDFLDRVDLVGGGNWDSTRDSHVIRSSDVLVDCDDTLNRSGHMDWDINIVLLDIDLRDDVGGLGSDPGVGPHGGENLLLDNGVSGCRSSWDWSWGDGSIRCWGSWDGWGWQSNGLDMVLGSSSSVGDSGLGNVFNTGNNMLMSGNNRLDSGLDNLVSNNTVLDTALNLGRSGSIAMVGLANNSWGRDHWGSSN